VYDTDFLYEGQIDMNSNSDSEVQTTTRAIGERLRAARRARGLSLSQLAALTDGALSKSRISNYEQGLRRLPVEVARTLANALGTISAVELLFLENDCPNLQPDEQQLLQLLRSSAPETRERILKAAILAAAQSPIQPPAESPDQPAAQSSAQPPSDSSVESPDQSE
jgi:transcriptional regulator with XRE-family HTH domain